MFKTQAHRTFQIQTITETMCFCCLLLHNKSPQIQALNLFAFSPSFAYHLTKQAIGSSGPLSGLKVCLLAHEVVGFGRAWSTESFTFLGAVIWIHSYSGTTHHYSMPCDIRWFCRHVTAYCLKASRGHSLLSWSHT